MIIHSLRYAFEFLGWFGVEIKLPSEDIHLETVKRDPNDLGERRLVCKGNLFLRDLSFIPEWEMKSELPRVKLIEFLVERLSLLKLEINHSGRYQFQSSSPVSEDADQMVDLIPKSENTTNSGSTQEPPTIVLEGVPSQWFSNHDSSKPSSQRLRSFSGTFGKIRDLYTSKNDENATYCNVAIQHESYEECYKALKHLCSFSLQKVQEGGSKLTADYEVTWKDYLVPVSQEVHLNKSLSSPCDYSGGSSPKQVSLAPVSEDMSKKYQALELKMAVLEERFKSLEAKLGAGGT